MSHFAVLVIGENIEGQLAPYQESMDDNSNEEYFEFHDLTPEYKEDYETGTSSEFYCSSNSSWGQEITEDLFKTLEDAVVGRRIIHTVEKSMGLGSYYKLNGNYRGYYPLPENKRCEGDVWFKVTKIIESTHPTEGVCFDGVIQVQKIDPPKELPNKDAYTTFEEFCLDYCGSEPNEDGRYGYMTNPNAKWDWFQIGGRYRDRLKMKQPELALKGGGMEAFPTLYRESTDGYGDVGLKSDIDFDAMHGNQKDYDEAIRFWEMKIDGSEPTTPEEEEQMKFSYYKDAYYTDRYKTKEVYAKCMANFTMWAILKDGKWYEKGEMGMFGMSGESGDEALEWELNFYDTFIAPLDDNTLITVVDCHI